MTQQQSSATKYQLLKNLQQSLISIAGELRQVKTMLKSEQISAIAINAGRLEGLAQGLDFHAESFNGNGDEDTKVFGFQLPQPEENVDDNVPE